jgi:response regulator NasT
VTPPLRILIANERPDRIASVTELVVELGHVASIASTDLAAIGEFTADEHPDVALVGLGGGDTARALKLIELIVSAAGCPVIALLDGHDAEFIDEAAKRGVFAYVADGTIEELRGALDITLCRFAAYHDLQGAFGRRALTERAKGILMERYQVDDVRAFAMLRDFSRTNGLKITRVAQAVVEGDLLRKPREE